MVKALHRRGHRGDPRRGLQPHRRGQPPRARRCRFRGIDNAAYYRLVDDDTRYYMDYTGTGNTPQRAAPARAAADHGLAALLGARDARRRLPLRPRLDARPRVLRRRPAVHVLRARAAGPGGHAGQADRRAVGRRPGRLPGRQLPAAVDRVERQVPRHGARLLARRAVTLGEFAIAAHRLGRPLRARRAAGPSRRINFVTAHDGFTLRDLVSYNDKHNEANGEDNRDGEPTTTGPGTAASRGRPTTPRCSRCAPGSSATSSPPCCSRQGVPMLLARRRARPHPAGQQQRLRPGHRDSRWVRLGRRRTARWSSSPPRSPGCGASTRPSAAAGSSTAGRCGGGGRAPIPDIVWLHPDGTPMQPERLGLAVRHRLVGDVPQRRRHPRARPPRPAHHRPPLHRAASTPATTSRSTAVPEASSPRAGTSSSTPRGSTRTTEPSSPGRARSCPRQRSSCSASTSVEPEVGHTVAASSVTRRRLDEVAGAAAARRAVSRDPASRPISTYRLQIRADFDLDAAAGLADYLARARRRLGLPLADPASAEPGTRPRLRRGRPRPGRPVARRRAEGLARAVSRGPRGRARRARRHRAQPRRRRHAGREPVVVGRAAARPRGSSTPPRSTSTGTPAAAGCRHPGARATTTRTPRSRPAARRRRAPLPRPPLPARAGHPATATTRAVHGRQHYELVNWRAPTTGPELPPVLRASPSWPPCGSRTPRCSTSTHAEIGRWFDEGLVDGLRVDHPTGSRDPGGVPRRPRRAHRRRLRPGREDPGARRARCRSSWATDGHHRLRRAGRHRPRARRPAGRTARRSTPAARTAAARRTRRLGRADRTAPSARRRRHPALGGAAASRATRRRAERDARPGRGRRRASCSPASRSTAPTCPRAASTSTHAVAEARAAPARPRRHPRRAAPGAGGPRAPRRPCASSRPAAW